MSTRNLDALFAPRAITVVGASNAPGSVGAVIARNLLNGGFAGAIMPVNPHETVIQGAPCFHTVTSLPKTPDLAVIATPPAAIPDIVAQLGALGCRAAIVITAGLDAAQRQRMLDAARPHLLRIMGPNCLGFLSPGIGVNASFSHLAPVEGDIAFLTQSGAIATSIIDWANGRGIGFSHIASIGDMSDVDFGDLLDFLALDANTRAILMYVETVTHARKFMSAARIAARTKPVLVVKAGRGAAGAKAAASHTGALAGADIVYDAAFRRAGMLRVSELRDLFDAAETLASGVRLKGDRLTILTNGGGLGVIAADALDEHDAKLAPLPQEALTALDAVLPKAWSRANPVDILGDASGARYGAAFDALALKGDQDAMLVMNCPTGVVDTLEAARAVAAAHARHADTPLLACWMGEATTEAPRRTLAAAGVPNYETPEDAVRAFLHLADYARNQAALLQAAGRLVERQDEARAEARTLVSAALAAGRSLLTSVEAKRLIALYGVPVIETRVAKSALEARAAAETMEGPFALKILSPDITHKSDVGGVALRLDSPSAVERAAGAMLKRVAAAAPNARLEGFTLEPMLERPFAQELILGVNRDATFGPAILFGHGGVAAEVIADRVLGLPPLNAPLALDMIARTRVAKLLAGYRDRPRVDFDAIVAALIALSDLVIDIPEIVELDINPLLADGDGVIALDARVVVKAADGAGDARLAIRPYPHELAHDITLPNGVSLHVRPIRPDDAALLAQMAAHTSAEDLRLRFHGAMREIGPDLSARLTQIDYDREMAFVAVEPGGAVAGVARLVFDPDFDAAEYALIVRSDAQGQGLGRTLMAELLGYAKAHGARRVWGDVLAENQNMLTLVRALGASVGAGPEGMRSEFRLAPL